MHIQPWNRIREKITDKRGFTLLETMIGMMIFAVGISAVLFMEVEGINMHSRSRDHVEKVQGAILQNETIGPALRYDDDMSLLHDDSNATYGESDPYGEADMPVRGYANASYTVKQDEIVRQVKMVYLTNKRSPNEKAYTITWAKPYMGIGSSD